MATRIHEKSLSVVKEATINKGYDRYPSGPLKAMKASVSSVN